MFNEFLLAILLKEGLAQFRVKGKILGFYFKKLKCSDRFLIYECYLKHSSFDLNVIINKLYKEDDFFAYSKSNSLCSWIYIILYSESNRYNQLNPND